MDQKTVLITGATDGIGKQTALTLAAKGFRVLVHGRDENKCRMTAEEIQRKFPDSNPEFLTADLSSMRQVSQLASIVKSKPKKLDVLINNAGVYMLDKKITADGFEMTFAVNHLSVFLLTNLLLGSMNEYGRIITVSSVAHSRANLDFTNLNSEKHFDAYNAYAVSKLANVLFTYFLSVKNDSKNITANCLHPGVITTKLLRTGFNISGRSVEEGASSSIYLASSEEVKNVSGKYFTNSRETDSSKISYDAELQKKLWQVSERMLSDCL